MDTDEDEEAARKAAKLTLSLENSQLFGLESQSLPDKPSLATVTTPTQAWAPLWLLDTTRFAVLHLLCCVYGNLLTEL